VLPAVRKPGQIDRQLANKKGAGIMLEAIRSLKGWQAGVLAAVMVGAVGLSYGVYALTTDGDEDALEEGQQVIVVRTGDLVNEVSTNGSLVYPNRETLTFGIQGTIGEVLVEEGQAVSQGQDLVTLDSATVASLEKAVAQAQVNLDKANEALAKARDPHTALELAKAEAAISSAGLFLKNAEDAVAKLQPTSQQIAQAEAAVASAGLSLQSAEEAVTRLQPTPQQIAQAEAAVASAGLSLQGAEEAVTRLQPTPQQIAQAEATAASSGLALQSAKDALDGLLNPSTETVAKAESAVTDARLTVDNLTTALDALKGGPSDDDVQKAESQIDSARTALANAQRDLTLAQTEWDAKLRAKQETADARLADYRAVFAKWLGIILSDEEEDMDPDALLLSWNVDLGSIFDQDSRFFDLVPGLTTQGIPLDDPATPWSEPVVFTWTNFYPGAIAVECEGSALPHQGACIGKELASAWDAHSGAVSDLATVGIQQAKAIDNAQIAVARAEDGLIGPEDGLVELLDGPTLLELEAKGRQLELALVTRDRAVNDLADLVNGPDPLEVESKRRQVTLASANLVEAEDALAELLAGAVPVEITAKQTQVAVAQEALAQAEEDLAKLLAGTDPVELTAKQAQVAVAQEALAKAGEDLAELVAGADPVGLEAKQQQAMVAQAALTQTEKDLDEIRDSPDPLEMALRETEVASARVALSDAEKDMANATLMAPMDGIVSVVNVEAGGLINRNTPIVEVVDATVVEVDGIVDEIDVLFVRVGASATVTMDALPGEVLDGVVSDVGSAARSQQGVVSYPIRIQVQVSQGMTLPEGLSAVAGVVIREDRDVLLVPLQALYGTFDQPLVRVISGGEVEERPVVLGNSDDFWAVVREGLAEGEQLVMQSEQASTTGFGFGGGFRPGGGFGGGGFRQAGGGTGDARRR